MNDATTDNEHLRLQVAQKFTEVIQLLLTTTATLPAQEAGVESATTQPDLFTDEPPRQQHLFEAGVSEPPKKRPRSRAARQSLWKIFKQRDVQEALALGVKRDTVRGYWAAVREFCFWFRENDPRFSTPGVMNLDIQRKTLEKYFSWLVQPPRALRTAANRLNCLSKVWRTLYELGYLKKPCPRIPTARKQQIIKNSGNEAPEHIPIGISLQDGARLVEACRQVRIRKPRFGDLNPREFYQLVIAAEMFHGLNPGDIFGLREKHNGGLHWSEVSFDPVAPFRGADAQGAVWPFGWLKFRRNKTNNKSCVPISPHMRVLIDNSRGHDDEIVFPFDAKEFKGTWKRNIDAIKTAAGLRFTQEQLKKAEAENDPDVYDVSLSAQAPSRSCRKRAGVLFVQHGSQACASHMLAHSTRAGRVSGEDLAEAREESSKITRDHYTGATIFTDVITAAPHVAMEVESKLFAGIPSLLPAKYATTLRELVAEAQ